MLRSTRFVASVVFLSVILACETCAAVFFVDADAQGANTGTSWANAFTTIQAAVDAAGIQGGGEVWVKRGWYASPLSEPVSDSYEAINPDAVDIIGEEKHFGFTSGSSNPYAHLTVLYLTGDVTQTMPSLTLPTTTDANSYVERLQDMQNGHADDVIVFANHPSDESSPLSDVLAAANANAIRGMEINGEGPNNVAWWDYVLGHLDDQAGACDKVIWGIRSDDSHTPRDIGVAYMLGRFPTAAQNPVYANRRIALRDVIRSGRMVAVCPSFQLGMPTFTLGVDASDGTAAYLRVQVFVGPTSAPTVTFHGCNYSTGESAGYALRTAPLTPGATNTVTYYFTRTGDQGGIPLTAQEKANIKYLRVDIGPDSANLAHLQPVRITSAGTWWNGPNYALSGGQGPSGPNPYPESDQGAVCYFNTHSHSWMSDGELTQWTVRKNYHQMWKSRDPSKACFDILTDHSTRTPFSRPIRNVVTLRDGVKLYGGFAGTETSRDPRDIQANPTVIDGQNGARCIVADASGWANLNLVIDGFTIERGQATGGAGGGLFISGCTPSISNCTFKDNTADYGGGICSSGASAASLSNCAFTYDEASARGGGVLATNCTATTVSNSSFTDCGAISSGYSAFGGAIYCWRAPLTVTESTLSRNQAVASSYARGGGICCDYGGLNLARSTIADNTASGTNSALGGGVYLTSPASIIGNSITGNLAEAGVTPSGYGFASTGALCCGAATLTNNTIADNAETPIRESGGGTAYGYSSDVYCSGTSAIANNIVAFNTSGISAPSGSTLSNNCVIANGSLDYQGVAPGASDIALDPLFVSRAGGDYHLSSGSPCLNAGLNTATGISYTDTDIDARPRICGGRIDIGADEILPAFTGVGSVLKLGDLYWGVEIRNVAVTACPNSGQFYAESLDRTAGIRVEKAAHGLSVGQLVDIVGYLNTPIDDQHAFVATKITVTGTASVAPLAMTPRSIGGGNRFYDPSNKAGQKATRAYQWTKDGSGPAVRLLKDVGGLNNIGLLVTTWGKVTHVAGMAFNLEDGSHFDDGNVNQPGLRITVQASGTPPTVGSYVRVTGVVAVRKVGGVLFRQVIVRRWADVEAL